MIGEALDRLISVFSPHRALQRALARQHYLSVRGLDGGKQTSRTHGWMANSQSANALPLGDVQRTRSRSWDLYWNNVHARKIIRSIESRTVGTGLWPEPQIMRADGSAHDEANALAKRIFRRWCKESDYCGKPGRGGQDFIGQQRLAIRSVALSGDVLVQRIYLKADQAMNRELETPYVVHVIHGERLSDSFFGAGQRIETNNYVYRGIEFNQSNERVAYWISDIHPGDSFDFYGYFSASRSEPKRIPAEQILHLYGMEDCDQFRGIPWFNSILIEARDLSDYRQDELRAAALAACLVMGYKQGSNPNAFGAQRPDWLSSTDKDGNTQVAIPSGAILPLGDGDIQMFNPMRPNANAEAFSQFMLRGFAAGAPGVKPSTITGDYRESSFSSERSAENDAWPEIEIMQDWLAASFCQPVYEDVLSANVDQFLDVSRDMDRSTFTNATWSGPVARSINPKDDEEASALAIQNGTSSPQKEATMRGYNWVENLDEIATFCGAAIDKLKAAGVDEKIAQGYVATMLGLKQLPQEPPSAAAVTPMPGDRGTRLEVVNATG